MQDVSTSAPYAKPPQTRSVRPEPSAHAIVMSDFHQVTAHGCTVTRALGENGIWYGRVAPEMDQAYRRLRREKDLSRKPLYGETSTVYFFPSWLMTHGADDYIFAYQKYGEHTYFLTKQKGYEGSWCEMNLFLQYAAFIEPPFKDHIYTSFRINELHLPHIHEQQENLANEIVDPEDLQIAAWVQIKEHRKRLENTEKDILDLKKDSKKKDDRIEGLENRIDNLNPGEPPLPPDYMPWFQIFPEHQTPYDNRREFWILCNKVARDLGYGYCEERVRLGNKGPTKFYHKDVLVEAKRQWYERYPRLFT